MNVEAFRGAIIKGRWKLVKIALLPGKTELFDLTADPGEKNDVAGAEPGGRPRSREPPDRLRQRAENERVAEGAAGLPWRAGEDRLRSGLRHRRRRLAAGEAGAAEEVTCRPEAGTATGLSEQ
ncbi:MAG: hypothetical protein M0C28_11870 [Candidatus Moduliflexus flocculans]|nr:hypothetical protein [Candidatus Moduliflexus flocculans]